MFITQAYKIHTKFRQDLDKNRTRIVQESYKIRTSFPLDIGLSSGYNMYNIATSEGKKLKSFLFSCVNLNI